MFTGRALGRWFSCGSDWLYMYMGALVSGRSQGCHLQRCIFLASSYLCSLLPENQEENSSFPPCSFCFKAIHGLKTCTQINLSPFKMGVSSIMSQSWTEQDIREVQCTWRSRKHYLCLSTPKSLLLPNQFSSFIQNWMSLPLWGATPQLHVQSLSPLLFTVTEHDERISLLLVT